jgi:hypothetical protein
LSWLDSPPRRRAALKLIRWAETERFRNRDLHRELFDSIRFDVGWHAPVDQGLAPATLELPWIERRGFAMLRHWAVQRVANSLGAHFFVGWRGADLPCRLAPHLCVISACGSVETAALQAGRLLQRIWLHTTHLGLSIQVYAASPAYALQGSTSIGPALRTRRAEGWSELCGADQVPFLVFRMGHAPRPEVVAGRPDPTNLMRQQ